jgi:hypothetical protein
MISIVHRIIDHHHDHDLDFCLIYEYISHIFRLCDFSEISIWKPNIGSESRRRKTMPWTGKDKTRQDRTGQDKRGMEWTGMEWKKKKWNGMEGKGKESKRREGREIDLRRVRTNFEK